MKTDNKFEIQFKRFIEHRYGDSHLCEFHTELLREGFMAGTFAAFATFDDMAAEARKLNVAFRRHAEELKGRPCDCIVCSAVRAQEPGVLWGAAGKPVGETCRLYVEKYGVLP